MGWDQDMVPSQHVQGFTTVELQFRFALQDDNPFIFVLIVPESVRTLVPDRNNAFNPNVLIFCKDCDEFVRQLGGKRDKEIRHIFLAKWLETFPTPATLCG